MTITPLGRPGFDPSCFTVNDCPATVMVPLRVFLVVLAATVKPMLLLPTPCVLASVIQDVAVAAVHVHDPLVASDVDPLPPCCGIRVLVGDSEPLHDATTA